MALDKRRQERIARFLPDGIPRYARCYDNGGTDAKGGSADRYTVVFSGRFAGKTSGWYPYLAMSGAPFHPQGIGLHGETHDRPCDVDKSGWPPAMGRKCPLGTRIPFSELPPDCQLLALKDYAYYWDLVKHEDNGDPADDNDFAELVKQLPCKRNRA